MLVRDFIKILQMLDGTMEIKYGSFNSELHDPLIEVAEANIVGSDTTPITLDKGTIYSQFVKLALCLKNSDAVSAGVRPWVIINPTIESYLLQSTEFIGAHNVADETLREGAIGRIAGMDVLVSTNLTDVSGKYYYKIVGR